MNPPAVKAANLGKQYRIRTGVADLDERTVRTELNTLPHRFISLLRGDRGEKRTFWALKDVSLEIPRGEIAAIIGRNGSGKSTLMRILARITPPTTGSAELYCRPGALLDIGAGLHPELTGAENIYLGGALFGMNRQIIRKSFDAIVDFAEIGDFLHSPVKYYSQGMYLRLAFSISANLDIDLLLLDEVLSVGDTEFQSKCYSRIKQLVREGRTIVLVTHDLTTVSNFCSSAFLLEDGRLAASGDAPTVVRRYCDLLDARQHAKFEVFVDS